MTRLAAIVVIAAALAGCDTPSPDLQGWIEADFVYVGPDESGRVETLAVREGDRIARGAALFVLDTELQKADLAVAEAAVANARRSFERAQELLKTKVGSQKAHDDAEAQLADAEARRDAAHTRLRRRQVASPAEGLVQQVYFRPGELVAAGKPVVALLPPGNLKVRFFVPQERLPSLAPGERITVACDGCAGDLAATVTFVSRQAEYTPPVIYSLEERAKLVYMVEATPTSPEQMRVGQPVRVRRADAAITAEARR